MYKIGLSAAVPAAPGPGHGRQYRALSSRKIERPDLTRCLEPLYPWNPERFYEDNRNCPDPFLSGMYLTAVPSPLQVHSDLFPVRAGSGGKVWFSEGFLSGCQENTEMSSLP